MSSRSQKSGEAIGEAIAKGIFKLIGFVFRLIWSGIKAIFSAISRASEQKSRAVYAPRDQSPANESKVSNPSGPSATVHQPTSDEQSDPDPRFTESDALERAGNFTDALAALKRAAAAGDVASELRFKLAYRFLALWRSWDAGWVEPKSADFPDTEEYLAACRQRGLALSESLRNGVEQIELVLASESNFPNARSLGRELNLALAGAYRDWGQPAKGYKHQRRAIELSDPPIDGETYEMADTMAREGQCFGDFFDLSEALFKKGVLPPEGHFAAALSYKTAVSSEKYPLATTDRPREKEFLEAALGHLEYLEQNGLETGPHWHNTMAQVLARLGDFDEAMRHFEIFKQIAASEEPDGGKGMIALCGNETVRALRACRDKRR